MALDVLKNRLWTFGLQDMCSNFGCPKPPLNPLHSQDPPP